MTEIISGWMMKDIRIWQCILTNRAVQLDYTLYQLDRDGKLAAKRTIPDEEKDIFNYAWG